MRGGGGQVFAWVAGGGGGGGGSGGVPFLTAKMNGVTFSDENDRAARRDLQAAGAGTSLRAECSPTRRVDERTVRANMVRPRVTCGCQHRSLRSGPTAMRLPCVRPRVLVLLSVRISVNSAATATTDVSPGNPRFGAVRLQRSSQKWRSTKPLPGQSRAAAPPQLLPCAFSRR